MKIKPFLILLLALTGQYTFAQPSKGLKDYYKKYFPIGVAVAPRMMDDAAESALILAQFNSMTPENAMKMGPIHPEEKCYNWAPADKIADFAVQHGLKLRGHTLCWHSQTPNWFFKDSTGATVTKEVLLARLKQHIFDVVSRYKGKIYAWDVVNEAVPDGDGTDLYRKSHFTRSSARNTSKKLSNTPTKPIPKQSFFTMITIPKMPPNERASIKW